MGEEKQSFLEQQSPEDNSIQVQQHRSTSRIIFHAAIACMGSFFFGYSLGELNMAQDTLDYKYQIKIDKNLADGLLTSAVPLGAAIGCIIAGEMLNKMGRRTIFYIADIVGMVTCLLFVINSFWLAVILRFLMGLITGINSTVVPLYLREISPLSISGVIGIMNQGTLNFGILLGYIFGLGFPIEDQSKANDWYWRFVLMFPILTCLVRILGITFVFKNDTAQFYFSKNDTEKAREVIQDDYLEEYQDQIFNTLQHDAEDKKKVIDTWSLVFGKQYRSRLILGSLVSIFQQFSGINAIVFYSATIFENSLGNKELANYMTIVSGVILMAFAFMSGIFTKRYGRKPILMLGEVVLIITLVLVGIVSLVSRHQVDEKNVSTGVTVLIISLIFIYDIAFSLSLGPLAWVYNADILNSEKALGFATALNQACAFIIGLVFPSVQEAVGIYTTFFIFAGFCALGLAYFKFFLKETKGLTQKQIVALFVGEKQSVESQNTEDI